jgi:hypothetical protein
VWLSLAGRLYFLLVKAIASGFGGDRFVLGMGGWLCMGGSFAASRGASPRTPAMRGPNSPAPPERDFESLGWMGLIRVSGIFGCVSTLLGGVGAPAFVGGDMLWALAVGRSNWVESFAASSSTWAGFL